MLGSSKTFRLFSVVQPSVSPLCYSRTFCAATEYDYDICVIGGGPSGYAAAVRGIDFGKRVCLVEKDDLGGSGVGGALSSKMMWRMSRDHHFALQLSKSTNDSIHDRHYADIVNSVLEGQKRKQEQFHKQIERLRTCSASSITPTDINQHSKPGCIDFKHGKAKFINPHEITIESEEKTTKQEISSHYFVIATGSIPREPKEPKVDGFHIMTSEHLINLRHFPKSMLIIGAGVIGCEFATIFANFGRTKVYLLNNRKDRLLMDEDQDLSDVVSNNLRERGVEILNNFELTEAKVRNGQVSCLVRDVSTGHSQTIEVAHCLYSIGRIPNTKSLELEKAGVEVCARGGINVAANARSNVSHIFASGDVTADVGLVNVGEMEARHAVEVICSGEENSNTNLCYENIASIMFLEPEVACIGLSETGAKMKNLPYRVGVYAFEMVNRAIINGKSSLGYVKMIVANDGSERLLGMRAIGPEASAIIGPAQLIISSKSKVSELEKVLFPHPAISESVQECARMFSGRSIMKPQCFVKLLRLEEVFPLPQTPSEKQKRKPVVPTYK